MKHQTIEELKLFDETGALYLKLTVEQRVDETYISTAWYPQDSHEFDRHVKEFETCSGALIDMYRNAIADLGASHDRFVVTSTAGI